MDNKSGQNKFACKNGSKKMAATLAMTAILAASVLTGGCASKYGPQQTNVYYYPACYRPVGLLRADEGSTTRSTLAGAAGGALFGALIGVLATGKPAGALAGAAAGGAAGAVGANIYGKSQARQRDAALHEEYAKRMGEEAAGMSRATASARMAAQCYDTEFAAAIEGYKNGQMDATEFQYRYAEIRSGLRETAAILQQNEARLLAQNDAEYTRALEEGYTNPHVTSQPEASQASWDGKNTKSQKNWQKNTKNKKDVTKNRPTPTNTDQVAENQTPAGQWHQSRKDMETARKELDERVLSYERTVSAINI